MKFGVSAHEYWLEILRMSRAGEFISDKISATMIGPEPIISALEKLREATIRPQANNHVNVLMWSGFKNHGWLSTHPPLEQRIARLRALVTPDNPRVRQLRASLERCGSEVTN